MRTALIALGTMLTLAACSGPILTYQSAENERALHSYFRYYAAAQEMPVEVFGRLPDGRDAVDIAPGLFAAMSRSPGTPAPTTFVRHPPTGPITDFRMILVFGTTDVGSGRTACRDPRSLTGGSVAGPYRIQGAVCFRKRSLSQVLATLPTSQAATNPDTLERTVTRVVAALFPPIGPDRDRCVYGTC